MAIGYTLLLPLQDVNGWTAIPALQSGRNIYVSKSKGNDSNNGLSIETPVESLSVGYGLLHSGNGDHLLLRCGDTWQTDGNSFNWNNSGASRIDPFILTSYDDSGNIPGLSARPIVDPGANIAILSTGGGATPNHTWIYGIEFYASIADPSSVNYNYDNAIANQVDGIYISSPATDVHVEDCSFKYFQFAITFTGNFFNDIRIRRCEILDGWTSTNGHCEAMFMNDINNMFVDGNIFDHNGWYEAPSSGATEQETTLATLALPTIFNQSLYLDGCQNGTVKNNIFSNQAAIGIKFAAYDTDPVPYQNNIDVNNNLFILCPLAISLWGGSNTFATTDISIVSNIITEAGGAQPNGIPEALGFDIANCDNVLINNNYFINSAGSSTDFEFRINAPGGNQNGMQNLYFTANIVAGWTGEDGTGSGIINNGSPEVNVVLAPNSLSSVNWPRNIETYDVSIGGQGSSANFITQARNQTKVTWDTDLTAPVVFDYISSLSNTPSSSVDLGCLVSANFFRCKQAYIPTITSCQLGLNNIMSICN